MDKVHSGDEMRISLTSGIGVCAGTGDGTDAICAIVQYTSVNIAGVEAFESSFVAGAGEEEDEEEDKEEECGASKCLHSYC